MKNRRISSVKITILDFGIIAIPIIASHNYVEYYGSGRYCLLLEVSTGVQ